MIPSWDVTPFRPECYTARVADSGSQPRRRELLRASRARFLRIRHRLDLLAGLANVDPALEEGAVFDADALRNHVAGKRPFVADIYTVGGGQVAANLAQDHDLAGADIRRDHAVTANGYAIAGKVDRASHAAVNIKRFRPCHFALDDQRFSNRGLLLGVQGSVTWRRNWYRLDRSRLLRGRLRRLLRPLGCSWSIRSVGGLPHVSCDSFQGNRCRS